MSRDVGSEERIGAKEEIILGTSIAGIEVISFLVLTFESSETDGILVILQFVLLILGIMLITGGIAKSRKVDADKCCKKQNN